MLDWIGLYRAGDPNTSYLWWTYTQGTPSGTAWLAMPAQPGRYEFRCGGGESHTKVG
jgi:hypothetical protein